MISTLKRFTKGPLFNFSSPPNESKSQAQAPDGTSPQIIFKLVAGFAKLCCHHAHLCSEYLPRKQWRAPAKEFSIECISQDLWGFDENLEVR